MMEEYKFKSLTKSIKVAFIDVKNFVLVMIIWILFFDYATRNGWDLLYLIVTGVLTYYCIENLIRIFQK